MQKILRTKLMKRTVGDWLKVLVLLLDEAAVLVLVILLLQFLKIKIPLPLAIVSLLVLGILVFIIHMAVIPSFHWRKVSGAEGMIGTQGRVIEPLSPVGTIVVKSERWRAKAIDGNIGVNEVVEIIGLDGLTLQVKGKENSSIEDGRLG
jgi:membrane-bound ClpP family serine protease